MAPAADAEAPAATQPAATRDAPEQPAGDDLLCAPEVMVDGKCPPIAEEAEQPSSANPAAEAPGAEEPTLAPADASAPEAAPADDETSSGVDAAIEAEAVPEPEPAAGEPTPAKKPLCPPEMMVDGKCPPLPAEQPAQ